MIAKLAWSSSGVAVDAHPSDGDSTKIPEIALRGRVSYYYVIGVVWSFGAAHIYSMEWEMAANSWNPSSFALWFFPFLSSFP